MLINFKCAFSFFSLQRYQVDQKLTPVPSRKNTSEPRCCQLWATSYVEDCENSPRSCKRNWKLCDAPNRNSIKVPRGSMIYWPNWPRRRTSWRKISLFYKIRNPNWSRRLLSLRITSRLMLTKLLLLFIRFINSSYFVLIFLVLVFEGFD